MNLTEEEKNKANSLKMKFFEIRNEIDEINSQIESLNEKSGSLISTLEDIRKQESEFMESLRKKYGNGTLDPFKLIYS